jgi:hypothetical protein
MGHQFQCIHLARSWHAALPLAHRLRIKKPTDTRAPGGQTENLMLEMLKAALGKIPPDMSGNCRQFVCTAGQ